MEILTNILSELKHKYGKRVTYTPIASRLGTQFDDFLISYDVYIIDFFGIPALYTLRTIIYPISLTKGHEMVLLHHQDSMQRPMKMRMKEAAESIKREIDLAFSCGT
jgi:predicted membrane protein